MSSNHVGPAPETIESGEGSVAVLSVGALRQAARAALSASARTVAQQLRSVLRLWYREHAIARTVDTLRALDDATLRDIGLTRCGIRAAAEQAVDKEHSRASDAA